MRAGHQKCKGTNTMATVTNSISQRKSGSECVPHVCLKVSGRIPLYWPKRYKLHDLDNQDNNSILCCNLFWTMIHTYNTST